MKKVNFKLINDELLLVKSISDDFILLSYLVGDYRGKKSIQPVIDILEKTQKGEVIWEDIINNNGGCWDFGNGYGELDIDGEMAYLISTDRTQNPSMSLPLQELIDIFKEWNALW